MQSRLCFVAEIERDHSAEAAIRRNASLEMACSGALLSPSPGLPPLSHPRTQRLPGGRFRAHQEHVAASRQRARCHVLFVQIIGGGSSGVECRCAGTCIFNMSCACGRNLAHDCR